jgi:hypothetical protein
MAERKLPRSAKTGRIVTMTYAKTHPSTTVIETVKIPRKRGK